MPAEPRQSPEDELNCAEEVLDAYAAHLELEQTMFDCIGDYITAVVEATQKKYSAAAAKPPLRRVTNYAEQAAHADLAAEALVKMVGSGQGIPGSPETTGEVRIRCTECGVGMVFGKKTEPGIHDEMTITGAACDSCGKTFTLTFNR